MKKHNCENYRYTTEKYSMIKNEEGVEVLDTDNPKIYSWCSLCGHLIRGVKIINKIKWNQNVLKAEKDTDGCHSCLARNAVIFAVK